MMRVLATAVLLALGLVPVSAQRSHLLVITGLGGEPSYSASFATSGAALVEAARRWSLPAEHITWLVEDTSAHDGLSSGRSTRDGITAAFSQLTRSSQRGDTVLVVLVGHGSGEGIGSKLSVPGPDPTATDYAGWLDALAGRVVVVVVAASGSGDFLPVLSRPGRIVITATKSSTERNESLFGARWVQGLTSGEADANKDGRITVLESYQYATAAVARVYEADKRLMTEHAMLDDDGDGKGSAVPGADGSTDGVLARRVGFGGPDASTDPRVVALVASRSALEADVEALRRRRGEMSESAYLDALETLVVRIAEISKQIRTLDGNRTP
ncbi:MAG TPA: hypothetical protein VFN22_05025 [Gemmatimonadales bacterium]|nr:hypothetical protein [Gemmatimonadales bacterium]